MLKVKAQKDLYAGLIYVCLGAAFLWFGRDYRIGTASRMGPGYFPMVLAWILVGFGVISLVRSFVVQGERVTGLAWLPMFWVLAGCAAFAAVLQPLGLVISLIALCTLSFAASIHFKVDGRILLGLAALIAFCVLVFVKGLGVPLPIFGSWFEPFLPQWLIR